MNVKDELNKCFEGKNIDFNKIDENSTLKDVGLDSLDLVEGMLQIEDKFQIEFTSEELQGLHTLKDVCNLVEKKIK